MAPDDAIQGNAPQEPGPALFRLPADLTIFGAAALKSQLSSWFAALAGGHGDAGADEAPVLLDASAVGEADASGIQLLLAFSRSLAAHGRALRLVHAGSLLAGACQALGVPYLLADEPAGATR